MGSRFELGICGMVGGKIWAKLGGDFAILHNILQ